MGRWLILASLLCATAVAGPAYRWVDENGQVHYSDRPREGAETIQLPVYKSSQPRGVAQRPATPQPAADAQPEPSKPYQTLDIVRPEMQETLWNTGGVLDVSVNIQPRLAANHRMVVYLDGEALDFNPGSPNFQLTDVYRGMHTIQVAVVDAFDQQIVRSLPVQFMIQQTSILNPQRANPPPAQSGGSN